MANNNSRTTNRGRNGNTNRNKNYSNRKKSNFDKDYEEEEHCPANSNSKSRRNYKSKGSNDPQWYATDPALLRDAASIPFSWALGTSIDLHNELLSALPSKGVMAIPGICTLALTPSVGISEDANSPINVASTAVYSYIRHANSGHANYDSPDLMLYLLAMTQIYSYINMLQRTYGIATLYSQRNRYMPKALLAANFIDFEDINNNLANFRYGINVLINKVASLAVPTTMTIFNRHAFLYQNVYCEGESIKDQLYMYTPYSFLQFGFDSSGAGKLEEKIFEKDAGASLYTVDELLTFGNSMLDQILLNEDMNIMSGDILKTYGQNIIKLQSLDTFYPIVPLVNINFLEQFKNATVVGNGMSGISIKQNDKKAYLISKYQATFTESAAAAYVNTAHRVGLKTLMEDKILTTLMLESNPEMVMENTRLMVCAKNYNASSSGAMATVDIPCGSEVVRNCTIWYYEFKDGKTPTLARQVWKYNTMHQVAGDEAYQANNLKFLSLVSNFKFHPAVHLLSFKEGSTAGTVNISDGRLYYDVDNYAVINGQDLEKLHESALLNQLNVPSIAKLS